MNLPALHCSLSKLAASSHWLEPTLACMPVGEWTLRACSSQSWDLVMVRCRRAGRHLQHAVHEAGGAQVGQPSQPNGQPVCALHCGRAGGALWPRLNCTASTEVAHCMYSTPRVSCSAAVLNRIQQKVFPDFAPSCRFLVTPEGSASALVAPDLPFAGGYATAAAPCTYTMQMRGRNPGNYRRGRTYR